MHAITVYANREAPSAGRVSLEVGKKRHVTLTVNDEPVKIELTPDACERLAQHLRTCGQIAAHNRMRWCPSCGRRYIADDELVCEVCAVEDATGVRG